MENKFKFKKFLATASAFAMIAGSTSAMGIDITTGGNEALSAIGTWVGGAAPADDDGVIIGNNGDTLTLDVADRNISKYDNDGKNPGNITVVESGSLGSMVGAGNGATIVFGADNKTLILTGENGNSYAGLKSVDFANKDSQLTIANGQTVPNFDSTGGPNGTVNFDGAAEVTGKIGDANALKEVKASGAGVVNLSHAGDAAKATTFTVAHADAEITSAGGLTGEVSFTANGKVNIADGKKITGDVTTTGENVGQVIFAKAGEVTGTLGAADNALKLVEVTGAGDVTLAGKSHYAETFNFKDVAARLIVADGGKLYGDLVANGAGDGNVQFAKDGEIMDVIGKGVNAIALIDANGAGTVTINAGAHNATLNVSNNDATILMKEGANLTGNITNTGNAANSTVTFEGSSKVAGSFAAGAAIKDLNANGADGKTLQITGNVVATNLNIGKGSVIVGADLDAKINFTDADKGKLVVSKEGDQTITGVIAHDVAKKSHGIVEVTTEVAANATTFASQIGDKATDAALALLDIQNVNPGGSVVLAADSHITKLQAAGEGTLKISGDHKIESLVLAKDGELGLSIGGVAKLMSADGKGSQTNYGTDAAKLGTLSFAGKHTLTLEDGVNVYAASMNPAVDEEGTLTFEGSSILDAVSGANKINAINVNGGEGKVVHIAKNITANGTVTLADKSTLEIAGDITAGNIKGAAAGNGTLKFVNTLDSTVDSTIGTDNAVEVIELAGKNVTFTKGVTHDDKVIKFTADIATTATFDESDVQKAHFVNGSADVAHKVVFGKNVSLEGKLGTVESQMTFDLGVNNITATLSGDVDSEGANFVGTNGGANGGTLVINKEDVKVNTAGTKTAQLLALNINQNAEIAHGTAATTTTVNAGITGTFGGKIEGTTFTLVDADSQATFKKDAILDVAITGKGIVDFEGAATVNKDIGTSVNKIKEIKFGSTAGDVLTLNANAYASDSINLKTTTIKLAKNTTLESAKVNTSNASIDLGSNNLTLKGAAKFDETTTIATTVSKDGDTVVCGTIDVADGGTINYNGSKFVINADDSNVVRPAKGVTQTVALIKNSTGAAAVTEIDLENVTITSSNVLTKLTPIKDADTGGLSFTRVDNSTYGLSEKIKNFGKLSANDSKNIELLTSADAGTDAYKIVDLLAGLSDAKSDEALDRLHSVSTTTDNINGTMSNVASSISQRVSAVQSVGTSVQSKTVANAYVTGVASGDASDRFGAWFSPFYSKTNQKARKGQAGYNDTTFGGSLGVDTKVNDDMMIGGAVTVANSEAKHKNQKSGDNTKVNSVMLSVYGMQQINDLWFAQASATVGSNEVNNTERKNNLVGYDSVKGKYSAMSFAGDLLFGFNYAAEGVTLTPMGGMRYSRVNSSGFKQSGSTTGQNADVSQKASNKFELVLGGKVAAGMFDVNGVSVTPELHGFINYDIIGKSAKVEDRIGGLTRSLATVDHKPSRASYNIGLGVNAGYGMMEYGAGYDLHLADKRVGHEGSLKVRVNF